MQYFHPRLIGAVSKDKSLKLPFQSNVLKVDEKKVIEELKDFAINFENIKKLGDTTHLTDKLELKPELEVNNCGVKDLATTIILHNLQMRRIHQEDIHDYVFKLNNIVRLNRIPSWQREQTKT